MHERDEHTNLISRNRTGDSLNSCVSIVIVVCLCPYANSYNGGRICRLQMPRLFSIASLDICSVWKKLGLAVLLCYYLDFSILYVLREIYISSIKSKYLGDRAKLGVIFCVKSRSFRKESLYIILSLVNP